MDSICIPSKYYVYSIMKYTTIFYHNTVIITENE